jgi:hypothetical protein
MDFFKKIFVNKFHISLWTLDSVGDPERIEYEMNFILVSELKNKFL